MLRGLIKGKPRNGMQILPFIVTSIIVIVALMSYFFIVQDDLLPFLILLSLIPIFIIMKFDGRILIGYAIVLLVLAAGIRDLRYSLSVSSYWLLVDGISCLLIDLYRKKSHNDELIQD